PVMVVLNTANTILSSEKQSLITDVLLTLQIPLAEGLRQTPKVGTVAPAQKQENTREVDIPLPIREWLDTILTHAFQAQFSPLQSLKLLGIPSLRETLKSAAGPTLGEWYPVQPQFSPTTTRLLSKNEKWQEFERSLRRKQPNNSSLLRIEKTSG